MPDIPCSMCGTVFHKCPNKIAMSKTGNHYCSHECAKAATNARNREGRVAVKCAFCGRRLIRTRAEYAKNRTGVFWCGGDLRAECYRSRVGVHA